MSLTEFPRGELLLETLLSEVDCERDDDDWFAFVGVEDIGCEVKAFVCDAREDAALDVAVGFIKPGALGDHADAEPLEWVEGQLRPVVEEAFRSVADVHDVFALAVELELPPTQ